jgi:hypothetical protein
MATTAIDRKPGRREAFFSRSTSRLSVCLFLLTGAASGCRKSSATTAEDAGVAVEVADVEVVDAGPAVLPARCVPSVGGVTLGAPNEIEIGEAVQTPRGFAIGVLRKANGETVGSVAFVSSDAKSVTFVDLGPPLGDAPPPRVVAQGAEVYAAFYARPAPLPPGAKPRTTRELGLHRIADGKATATSTIAQQRDESLAYDFALGEKGGVVAWDEDAIGNERGNIKLVTTSADTKTLTPARIASPEGSDAEVPHLVARKGGFWLAWVAGRLEAPDAGLEPGQAIERPAEKRRFTWIELVALDGAGAQVGGVKRLTSNSGHVSMFDLAPRAGGDVLDVIARDDEQQVTAGQALGPGQLDGAGGRIVRITVSGDKAEPPIAIVSESVGRGAPDLLDPAGGASWLAFSDTHDRVRLVPLDATRTPTGPMSGEDALDKARVLLVMAAGAPAATDAAITATVLAAFPDEPEGQIRFVTCTR